MEASLERLFSLCRVFCILFSTITANNSSYKHILPYNNSSLRPILVNSLKGEQFPISEDREIYLTSPWQTTFVPSVHTLVVVVSLPLNIMAVLMFVVKIKLKKPAVVYMLNLASADLLLVAVLPFKMFYRFTEHNWPFGPGMCRFLTSTFFCNTFCSMMLMTAISVDRCFALLYPMQSLSWRTVRRASFVCAAIWLVAVAAVIHIMTTEQTWKMPKLNITTCVDALDPSTITTANRYYAFVLSILFFFIPLLISTVCYVRIIRKLSSSKVATNPGKKRRAILLSVAVLSSFIFCFGPMNILSLVQIILPDKYFGNLYFAYNLTLSFSTINCCLDPLIYYYASSECQRQVWNLLCPGKFCDVEKNIQGTRSNTATYSSGLGHLIQS